VKERQRKREEEEEDISWLMCGFVFSELLSITITSIT
jgi:hypothetical protein